LDGILYGIYQTHTHRGLKTSPEKALQGCISKRQIPPARLVSAFLQEKRLKAHPKTGEVEIQGLTYLVPDALRGKNLIFLIDPPAENPPVVLEPNSKRQLPLRRADVKSEDLPKTKNTSTESTIRWGSGILQTLYDNWKGQHRPLTEPGFGLPEIYVLLAKACDRHVPQSDAEAALIQKFYANIGPLPQKPTEKAFSSIIREFGQKRPVKTYLDALHARVQTENSKERM
jgi:hypothetical protein